MMMDTITRKKWQGLRFSYYTAARTVHISKNYVASGILFGYAVETSLKHALIEVGYRDRSVLHSHDMKILMQAYASQSSLEPIVVSDDFLQYINDFFKPRYPRLHDEVVTEAQADGRFLLKSIDFIPYYDDLVLQIDDAIYALTQEIDSTIGTSAIVSLHEYSGRVYFHANYAACARLNCYSSMVPAGRIPQASEDELAKGVKHLWNCGMMYQFFPREPDMPVDWHPASDFEYPKRTEKNGVKSIQIKLPFPSDLLGTPEFVPDEL